MFKNSLLSETFFNYATENICLSSLLCLRLIQISNYPIVFLVFLRTSTCFLNILFFFVNTTFSLYLKQFQWSLFSIGYFTANTLFSSFILWWGYILRMHFTAHNSFYVLYEIPLPTYTFNNELCSKGFILSMPKLYAYVSPFCRKTYE